MEFFRGFKIISSILLVLLLFVSSVRSQEVENEKEFKYGGGPNGPKNWGKIHKDWKACSSGQMQSPIDVARKRSVISPRMGLLHRRYKASNASLINRGHDIMVQWPSGGGWIMIEGKNFTLEQMHWHSPSEHTFNGRRYALEAHMVHKSKDDKVAVIALLYKYGKTRDSFLKELEDDIKSLEESEIEKENSNANTEKDDKHKEVKLGKVNPMDIKFGSRKYFRYIGSLTTPPCTEGVIWNILRKVRIVHKEQVHLLREAVDDGYEKNARPTQKLNGRTVRQYRPKKMK